MAEKDVSRHFLKGMQSRAKNIMNDAIAKSKIKKLLRKRFRVQESNRRAIRCVPVYIREDDRVDLESEDTHPLRVINFPLRGNRSVCYDVESLAYHVVQCIMKELGTTEESAWRRFLARTKRAMNVKVPTESDGEFKSRFSSSELKMISKWYEQWTFWKRCVVEGEKEGRCTTVANLTHSEYKAMLRSEAYLVPRLAMSMNMMERFLGFWKKLSKFFIFSVISRAFVCLVIHIFVAWKTVSSDYTIARNGVSNVTEASVHRALHKMRYVSKMFLGEFFTNVLSSLGVNPGNSLSDAFISKISNAVTEVTKIRSFSDVIAFVSETIRSTTGVTSVEMGALAISSALGQVGFETSFKEWWSATIGVHTAKKVADRALTLGKTLPVLGVPLSIIFGTREGVESPFSNLWDLNTLSGLIEMFAAEHGVCLMARILQATVMLFTGNISSLHMADSLTERGCSIVMRSFYKMVTPGATLFTLGQMFMDVHAATRVEDGSIDYEKLPAMSCLKLANNTYITPTKYLKLSKANMAKAAREPPPFTESVEYFKGLREAHAHNPGTMRLHNEFEDSLNQWLKAGL